MVTFPISGQWWLASVPDQVVSGTLDGDDDGTLTLRTIGGIEHDEHGKGPVRIWGRCGGIAVTLLDATLVSANFVGAADRTDGVTTTTEAWQTDTAVVGGHLAAEQKLYGVSIESYWFDAWRDAPLWRTDLSNGAFLAMSDEGEPSERAAYRGGDVQVNVGWSAHDQQRTWSIARNTTVTITPKDPLTLEECRSHVEHLDALTTLLLQRTTGPAEVHVFPDNEWRMRRRWALAGTITAPRRANPPGRMFSVEALASYEELGGIKAVAGWFGLSEDFTYLGGRIASHHRADGRFAEDRALMAFSVGEALDRVESGKTRDTARNRWQRLADASPHFQAAFLDRRLDNWITMLLDKRNDLAHALVTIAGDRAAARHLDALTTSAHVLATLTILRHADLHGHFDAIGDSSLWARMSGVCGDFAVPPTL